MRSWWQKARPGVLAALIHAAAKTIAFTLRVKVSGAPNIDPDSSGKIIASWHGRGFLGATKFGGRGWWALISHSRDGEMQNGIFRRFGFNTIRGSTKRGGARAAVEIIRVLKDGGTFVFTPDGPRGPERKVQPGIVWIAQKSGAKIVPSANSVRPRKIFNSWDHYLLPLPFAKCLVEFGEPISVPASATDDELQLYCEKLELELNRLEEKLERELGYA